MQRGRPHGSHQPAGATEAQDRHIVQSMCEAVVDSGAQGDLHHLLDQMLAPWPQLHQLTVQPVSKDAIALTHWASEVGLQLLEFAIELDSCFCPTAPFPKLPQTDSVGVRCQQGPVLARHAWLGPQVVVRSGDLPRRRRGLQHQQWWCLREQGQAPRGSAQPPLQRLLRAPPPPPLVNPRQRRPLGSPQHTHTTHHVPPFHSLKKQPSRLDLFEKASPPRDTHHSIEVPPPGSLWWRRSGHVMKERSPTKGCRAMIDDRDCH